MSADSLFQKDTAVLHWHARQASAEHTYEKRLRKGIPHLYITYNVTYNVTQKQRVKVKI